jgi:hypothetical protein
MGELLQRQVLERSKSSEIKREMSGGVTEDSRMMHRRIFCGLWSVCLLVIVISGLLRVHQSSTTTARRHRPGLRHSAVEGLPSSSDRKHPHRDLPLSATVSNWPLMRCKVVS